MDGGAWWAAVHGVAKSRTQLSDFTFTFPFHALEKEMATHSSVLAWTIPGTGDPGGLPSMGLHRVGLDWSDLAAAAYIGTYSSSPNTQLVKSHKKCQQSLNLISTCNVPWEPRKLCTRTKWSMRYTPPATQPCHMNPLHMSVGPSKWFKYSFKKCTPVTLIQI